MKYALSFVLFLLFLALAACGGEPAAAPPEATQATSPAAVTGAPVETALPTATPAAPTPAAPTPPDPSPTQRSLIRRPGAEYVLLLPREAAVPADWLMNPQPSYETRRPQPGDTYRFACLELSSRAVGQAAVGYRHIEGMPSINIEYVIYPTDDAATEALGDMARAATECTRFTIGEGGAAIAAGFSPLDFPAYGDGAFAASLATESVLTGPLVTHMIKVRSGHVVIGINHANYAGEASPDAALTESLVALAVGNLANGPAAPGE